MGKRVDGCECLEKSKWELLICSLCVFRINSRLLPIIEKFIKAGTQFIRITRRLMIVLQIRLKESIKAKPRADGMHSIFSFPELALRSISTTAILPIIYLGKISILYIQNNNNSSSEFIKPIK
ncbi:LOW QUALITY PROTEIN: hypothetical protein HZS_3378 [Henneguya salminicola]|nr:LOW QUALITY PROTEIN: hypothetical protein HZS_3378 [Henneguya salminicola]